MGEHIHNKIHGQVEKSVKLPHPMDFFFKFYCFDCKLVAIFVKYLHIQPLKWY